MMKTKIHTPRGAVVMFRVLLAVLMALPFIAFSSPVKAATPGLPDLVITNVTVTNMLGNPITEINAGQPFKVNVTVDNTGGDDYENCTGYLPDGTTPEEPGVNCEVDEVYVDVYIGPAPLTDGCDPAASPYNNTNNVDPTDTDIILADDPAKTISISVTVPNSQAGDLELYAYVDVNCSVDEEALAGESNNSYPSQPFRVNAVLNSLTFKSIGSQDGWILESTETSGVGGTKNNGASTIYIGDDASDRQYRSILSFNTASLDDTAVITSVTLRIRRNGVLGGGNPINIFKGLIVDVRKGSFGTSTLALGDFKASTSITVGSFSPSLNSGWYNINLISAKDKINLLGLTQLRLRFKVADNDNAVANILKLYSGNSTSKPQLIIEYCIP